MTAHKFPPAAADSPPMAAGGAPRTWTLTFPAGMELLNANGRHHWQVRQRVTKNLRWTGFCISRTALVPKLDRAHVTAVYEPPDRRRRDVANLYPAFKALIDGALVDAGVLPDDDDAHLVGPDMRTGEPHWRGRVLLIITEVPEEA